MSSSSTISFWRTLAHGFSHSVSYGLGFVWTNIHWETIKRDLAHCTHIRNMNPQNGGMWRLGYSIVPEPIPSIQSDFYTADCYSIKTAAHHTLCVRLHILTSMYKKSQNTKKKFHYYRKHNKQKLIQRWAKWTH